ncbi:MAG: DUF3987 domain-containing protein [Deltaproteobacteria bacterium]|nr:DUF3987 domain-containing protein [Deltaproteobacteria bacterium]
MSRDVEPRQEAVDQIWAEVFAERLAKQSASTTTLRPATGLLLSDEELLNRARNAKNGAAFSALYDRGDTSRYATPGNEGRSEGDLALCSHLFFWCGPNAERILRLWRSSALCRDKLNRGDYVQRTIEAVITREGASYSGSRGDFSQMNNHAAGYQNGAQQQANANGAAQAAPNLEAPVSLYRRTLAELPRNVFPPAIEDMVDATAAFTETPRELPLLNGLGAVAATTQDKFVIEARPGYVEPLNVWVLVGLDSGNRKTGVMKSMVAPIIQFEQALLTQLAPQIEFAQQEYGLAQKRIDEREKKAAPAKDDFQFLTLKQEAEDLRRALPVIPHARKYWEADVTPEALADALAENGGVIAIVSDEGGLFDILSGLYTKNSTANLDNFLKAHSGSPIRVRRKNAPPIDIPNPALTMVVSPQTGVLQGLVANPAFRGRGFLARPLYALPDSTLGHRTNAGTPVPNATIDAYHDCLTAILEISPQLDQKGNVIPYVLTLSDEAYAVWHAFQQQVEADMREDGRLFHLTDWGGKLPGQLLRVAGNVHVATFANKGATFTELVIAEELMRRVVALGEVLTTHALAVFRLLAADPAVELAKKIWRHVEKRRLLNFRERDALYWLKTSVEDMEQIRAGLDALVNHGYIEELPPPIPRMRKGRPVGQSYKVSDFFATKWR